MQNKYCNIFDVDKIMEYLKPYSFYLNESYIWDTPSNEDILNAKDKIEKDYENGILR